MTGRLEQLWPKDTGLRALVVDDDADIRGLLQLRLEARGFQVATAGNGAEALEELHRFPADLLLLDVSMPEMGGLEVLERVRAAQRDIAVIMSTAFGSEKIAIDALRKGADDYLRKPFEPAELRAVIERTMVRLLLRRQNDELRRQLDAELARAAEIQAGLLPTAAPELPGFDVAGRCIPARDVGGDFFDWQLHDSSFVVTVGDVMGKGIPAALLMATVRAALRAVTDQVPATALATVERALAADLERSDSFATLFHARLDLVSQTISYVDAGHGHAFVLPCDDEPFALGERSLPLGVAPDEGFRSSAVTLGPGEALVVYSDGLTDARPELALDHGRLAATLRGAANAAAMVDRLVELARGTGPLPDDLTVVVLRRQ